MSNQKRIGATAIVKFRRNEVETTREILCTYDETVENFQATVQGWRGGGEFISANVAADEGEIKHFRLNPNDYPQRLIEA